VIEVRDYDPAWPEVARHAIDELSAAAAGWLTRIEHIGSTSVPGLAAKPVIDLMAATGTLDAPPEIDKAVLALGYRHMPRWSAERIWFRREGEPVAYHLHVVLEDSWDTRNERILRDHLLEHPSDREAYGALKRGLAAAGHDADTYTRAKTALIQRMMDDARTARGLPAIEVWEE
jgi:GrpB-like predicted nucleotidyltransferase (UPF0157 family)